MQTPEYSAWSSAAGADVGGAIVPVTTPGEPSGPAPKFGLVVSGRPITMDFVSMDEEKFYVDVLDPGSAGEICVFLLPGVELPPGAGIVLVYSIPPFAEWRSLGTLSSTRPSGVFRTGWPADADTLAAPVVRVGLGLETESDVANVAAAQAGEEWDKLGFAQLVAKDLFNYVQSFAVVFPDGERIMMPSDALDRWLKKFEDRFRRDPNFLYTKAQQQGGL